MIKNSLSSSIIIAERNSCVLGNQVDKIEKLLELERVQSPTVTMDSHLENNNFNRVKMETQTKEKKIRRRFISEAS